MKQQRRKELSIIEMLDRLEVEIGYPFEVVIEVHKGKKVVKRVYI